MSRNNDKPTYESVHGIVPSGPPIDEEGLAVQTGSGPLLSKHSSSMAPIAAPAGASETFKIDVSTDAAELGLRSAKSVAQLVKDIVTSCGDDRAARIIFATGASQFSFIAELIKIEGLPWDRVDCFHLDEYVGITSDHPASFRKYLEERLFSKMSPSPKSVAYLDPADPSSYESLLANGPIDLACIGIGENGHIAFNDPPVADFNDPKLVKIVELDEPCRLQQVGEGWFESLDTTPTHAVSLTIPAMMRANVISCVVPDQRKANAVKATVHDAVSTACPATILRTHRDCRLWLDKASASLLP